MMGRPRIYRDDAERQRACRARRAGGAGTDTTLREIAAPTGAQAASRGIPEVPVRVIRHLPPDTALLGVERNAVAIRGDEYEREPFEEPA